MDLGLEGRVAVVAASSKGLVALLPTPLQVREPALSSPPGRGGAGQCEAALRSNGADVVAVRADVTTRERLSTSSRWQSTFSVVSTSSCRTPAAHRPRVRSISMTTQS